MGKIYIIIFFGISITGLIIPQNVIAQDEDAELKYLVQRIDSLKQAESIFRFGLSVGPRIILEERNILRRRNASISPADTTLQFDDVDKFEITIAGVVAAYPFIKSDNKFFKNLGFLAKLNLAEFGPDNFVRNKVIEGGFGLSYSMGREFSIGVVLERVTGKRIRSNFSENSKIMAQGDVIQNLDPTNDNIFVDDNFSALSLSWIYSF